MTEFLRLLLYQAKSLLNDTVRAYLMDTDADDWFDHVRVRVNTQLSLRGVHSRCLQEEPSVGGTMRVIIIIMIQFRE